MPKLPPKIVIDYIQSLYGPLSYDKPYADSILAVFYKGSRKYKDIEKNWVVSYYYSTEDFYFFDERKHYSLEEITEKANRLKAFL
jgi:hypothetical protein